MARSPCQTPARVGPRVPEHQQAAPTKGMAGSLCEQDRPCDPRRGVGAFEQYEEDPKATAAASASTIAARASCHGCARHRGPARREHHAHQREADPDGVTGPIGLRAQIPTITATIAPVDTSGVTIDMVPTASAR